MKLEFQGESASEPYILPSSSALNEIKESLEANNTKEADDKLTALYDGEQADKEKRESSSKKKNGFGFNPF